MRYKFLSIICLLFLIAGNIYAQRGIRHPLTPGNRQNRTTVADPAEDYYDVKYIKLDLNVNDSSVYISGNVMTTAQVTAATLSNYVFELDSVLVIDSVLINGQTATLQNDSFVHKAALPALLAHNDVFTVQVFYHGTPPTTPGLFFSGITHDVTPEGVNMMYTLSEPYSAKDWWPCKQSLKDKIDSADVWITVPQGQKAGSNGLLQAVSTPSAGYERYEWKTRYTIDYYLISMSVAPYFDYSYYMHFSNSTDSMLVQNYLYDSTAFLASDKANLDSVGMMINYFSQLFGRYPFDKEKYGHCFTTLSGGEEHQTMTTIGTSETPIVAHELGHQWFGDHVTCGTWQDLWLNEGFADYIEQLYVEHFWGALQMIIYRIPQYQYVTYEPMGSVYVRDTANTVDSLFDPLTVYYKGGGVVHMLRYLAQDDSLFFRTLRQYQQQFAFGNATTEDLKAIVAQQYGRNMDTFFNQWVYGRGFPTYTLRWNQSGNEKYLQLSQITSDPASVNLFVMPIKLHIYGSNGDTTITVYNNQQVQNYTMGWADSIINIIIDPNWDIIQGPKSVMHDHTLDVSEIKKHHFYVYSNPTISDWQVSGLADGTSLILSDMAGHVLWQYTSTKAMEQVPGGNLNSGCYLLHVAPKYGGPQVLKLVRQ